jgi:molybdenum cofactor cytidylyltransferase
LQVIHGIVLAAGMGRRIGMPKALLTLRGETLHHRAVSVLLGAGLDAVVVVNPVVSEALPPPESRERRLINRDPDQPAGMFSSVRLGIAEALRVGATGALLLPVDHPLVRPEDVAAVVASLRAGAAVVVAAHDGRRGHPVGVSAPVMAEILAEPLSSTLRDIVRRDPSRVVEVAASEGVLVGINTRDDLERVSNRTFR